MLQSVARAWDSLYGCYGVCLNKLWPKRTSKLSCATQSAGMPCFVQQNGVLMNDEVWNVVGSCFRSVGSSEKCLQSLLWLLLAGM